MCENNVPVYDPRQLDLTDTLYPLPVRLIFGTYLFLTGFALLFTAAGHDNLAYQLGALHVAFPQAVSWGVGLIECFGGMLLFVGFFTSAAAWLNILSISGLLAAALLSGDIPSDYGFSLLLIAGLVTLIIGGPGAYSIDRWLADPQPPPTPFLFSKEQKADIQGIILGGYGHLNFGGYLFLEFQDAARAKAWIQEVAPEIANSEDFESEELPVDEPVADPQEAQAWLLARHRQRFQALRERESLRNEIRSFVTDPAHPNRVGQITLKKAKDSVKIKWKPVIRINIAFTYGGCAALGLPQETLLSFPREFISGMSTRSEILGDDGLSDPEYWELGGIGRYLDNGQLIERRFNDNPPLHALLMFAALDQPTLDYYLAREKRRIAAIGGMTIVSEQGGSRPADQHEPFGFHDGISNPIVQGLPGHPMPNQWVVCTGDFVLGYSDEYQIFAPSPMVRKDKDPENMLCPMPGGEWPAFHNLGQNGSYVVYRKLEQDVSGFWNYMREQAGGDGSGSKSAEVIRLASKCVGRWPSGAPLVLTPDYDDPQLWHNNSFEYMPTDPKGFGCPIGAHIRRANPRDSFICDTPQESFQKSKRHRIARRSVSFGPRHAFDPFALERGVVPEGIFEEQQPRGIHFFAVNADIPRQFELVQHTWATLGNINALYNNKDPIIGNNDPASRNPSRMVIQRDPVRRHLLGMPRFVRVRGGEYFFLPSIKALQFLAQAEW